MSGLPAPYPVRQGGAQSLHRGGSRLPDGLGLLAGRSLGLNRGVHLVDGGLE